MFLLYYSQFNVCAELLHINPLYTNGLHPLIRYNKIWVSHRTLPGIHGHIFFTKMLYLSQDLLTLAVQTPKKCLTEAPLPGLLPFVKLPVQGFPLYKRLMTKD